METGRKYESQKDKLALCVVEGLKGLCQRKREERGPKKRKRKGRSMWSNLQKESGKISQQLKVVFKKFWKQTDLFLEECLSVYLINSVCT